MAPASYSTAGFFFVSVIPIVFSAKGGEEGEGVEAVWFIDIVIIAWL